MSQKKFKTLMVERPVIPFSPELAEVFGVCEALVLQQVHYWLVTKAARQEDGRLWWFNTYDDWRRELRVFSEATIKRTLLELRRQGVLVTARFNKRHYDRTLWYSIDYQVLCDRLAEQHGSIWSICTDPSGQIDLMEGVRMTGPIPKTNPKTSQENEKASEAGDSNPQGDFPEAPGEGGVHDTESEGGEMKAEDILKHHQAKKGQAAEKMSASGLASHWRKRWSLHNPGYMKPLTQADAGKLKHLWKAAGEKAYDAIDHALGDWTAFAWAVKKARGLTIAPTDPDIGFLLKHHDVALQSIAVPETPQSSPVKPGKVIKNQTEAVQSVVKPAEKLASEEEQLAALEELQALIDAKKGVT